MKKVVGFLVALLAPSLAAAEIVVSEVWARETVPGTSSSALFATLANTTRKPTQLVAVQVAGVGKAELHTHTQDGGMMRMRRVQNVAIGSRATVMLAPGGYHVMLFQLDNPLRAGSTLPVTFTFSNGDKVAAVAQVVGFKQSSSGPASPGPANAEHNEDHHNH
jgi:periplasmic copper chaperone A